MGLNYDTGRGVGELGLGVGGGAAAEAADSRHLSSEIPACRPSFPLTQIRMVRARRRAAGDGGGRLAAREAAVACRGWIGVGGGSIQRWRPSRASVSAPAPVTQPHGQQGLA